MPPLQRQILPNLGDLLDRLTISQIKEVKFPSQGADFARDMERVSHDINLLIAERQIPLTGEFIRIVVALSQLNLFIWHYKDEMEACVPDQPDRYNNLLKLAHQLNGVRNQLKNHLLEIIGDRDPAERKSNFNTDGLAEWNISIINKIFQK